MPSWNLGPNLPVRTQPYRPDSQVPETVAWKNFSPPSGVKRDSLAVGRPISSVASGKAALVSRAGANNRIASIGTRGGKVTRDWNLGKRFPMAHGLLRNAGGQINRYFFRRHPQAVINVLWPFLRSEERRVGKECR